ncbi:MAG: protein kinase [Clostridiales bacterium]|nr:protein kinase [Clostridiales bacterium]
MRDGSFERNGKENRNNLGFCPYCMSHVEPGEACTVCGLTQGVYQPAPHHLPPGTILSGRYLLGRVLGEGGFGITYIGRDLRLEMKVAVKEYFPVDRVSRNAEKSLSVARYSTGDTIEYEKGLKKFLYEARTLTRMEKQPEIVMVRDYFEANGTAYIVMEYVDGMDFVELLKQRGGRIPPEELFGLMEPLFGALSEVHKAGLLHRDISPDNLMLEKGKIRLLDFGCAREVTVGSETMTIALKQGYGPIEQYQGKGQGPWTDVYALSATIYFCLTGRKPPQALDRTLNDDLIPPRDLGVDITPAQQKALLKGMAVNPVLRYQSTEELYGGLYTNAETDLTEEISEDVPSVIPAVVVAGGQEKDEQLRDVDIEEEQNITDGNAAEEKPYTAGEIVSDEEPDIADEAVEADTAENEPDTEKADTGTEEEQNTAVEPAGTDADAGEEQEKTEEYAPVENRDGVTVSGFQRRHAALLGIICAAAAVVIIAVGVHSHRGNDSLPVDVDVTSAEEESETDAGPDDAEEDTGTESVPADISDYDKDAIFADAEPVEDYDALLTALADDSVTAITVNGSIDIASGEEMTLTKPLLLESGSQLNVDTWFTVSGDGLLWVEGDVNPYQRTRYASAAVLTDGGTIIVDEGSLTLGFLYREAEDDLIAGNENYEIAQILTVSEDDLFADAETVTTLQELNAALEDESVSAVIIKGTIALTEDLWPEVPVMVAEGSVLTAESGDLGSASLSMNNEILVNYGTVSCGLRLDGEEGAVVNYGTLAAENGAWAGSAYPVILNQDSGEYCAVAYQSVDGFYFYNLGTVMVDSDSGDFSLDNGGFYNYGSMDIRSYCGVGAALYNAGSITVADELQLAGFLRNSGILEIAEGGSLNNQGILELFEGGGRLIVEDGGVMGTSQGALVTRTYDGYNGMEAADDVDVGAVWDADYDLIDGDRNTAEAESVDGLLEALSDDTVERVEITGTVELSEDLTISKPVHIDGGGKLVLADGAVLTVTGTILSNNGSILCDAIVVEERAMLEAGAISSASGDACVLTVTGNSWVYALEDTRWRVTDLMIEDESMVCDLSTYGEGAFPAVTVTSESMYAFYSSETVVTDTLSLTMDGSESNGADTFFLLVGDLEAEDAQITVEDAFLFQEGTLTLSAGNMEIGENGEYRNFWSLLSLGKDLTVVNRGVMMLNDFNASEPELAGSFTNYGAFVLNGGPVNVTGVFDNQGALYANTENDRIYAENDGTLTGDFTYHALDELE